jgi:hypothetical protein
MAERQLDIGPLISQVQSWWDSQHAECPVLAPDPLGRPFDGLSFLYTQAELEYSSPCPLLCGWRDGQTPEQMIASLRPYLKAGAVNAAGLLDRPDAQIAEQVASTLLPAPFGDELTFVTDLIEAAGAQTVQGRNRKLVGAGAAGFFLILFLLARGSEGGK